MPRITSFTAGLVLALFCTAASAADLPPGVTQPLLLAPGKGNPRNSEGDFVRLKSGRLLFVYTHFTRVPGDHSPAVLASRYSDDAGRTWSDKSEVVVDQIGKMNVMSVSLLRLADGRIALFYLVKNSKEDCRPHVQFSSDEAKTWTEPKLCIQEPGYYILNNGRAIQLSKTKPGRIILPVARHNWREDKPGVHRGVAMCYVSDDNGVTFRKSETELEAAPPRSRSGLQEPLVVELKDGSLLMLCRTDLGSQYRSTSADGGITWTPAEPSDIKSPLSPASIARIPTTGDLLMAWNDHSGEIDPKIRGKRTPFTVAISKDEGKTWTNRKTLYADPEGWYCYTAITFADGRVLLGHCAGQKKPGSIGLATTAITAFGVEWLYK